MNNIRIDLTQLKDANGEAKGFEVEVELIEVGGISKDKELLSQRIDELLLIVDMLQDFMKDCSKKKISPRVTEQKTVRLKNLHISINEEELKNFFT